MSDQDQTNSNPEERAVSGNADMPPQQPDHDQDNDRQLLDQPDAGEDPPSGAPAKDGEGGSDQPGTTLPGYG